MQLQSDRIHVAGRFVSTVALGLLVAACSPSASPSGGESTEPSAAAPSAEASAPAAGGTTFMVENNTLPPVTAAVGEEVTWQNADSVPHTVTLDDNSVNGQLPAGGTFSHAFDTAGTFPYHCNIHRAMTGTITITG